MKTKSVSFNTLFPYNLEKKFPSMKHRYMYTPIMKCFSQ